MKKHAEEKKAKKWLVPLLCAILVLALGAVAAVLFLSPKEKDTSGFDGKLYWNVERETYKTGQYLHQNVKEDIYRLLFSVDGKQVKLDIKGMDLVNHIDTLDVMGFVFDENGIVVDVLHVAECTGGYVTNKGYVTAIEGDTVTINNNYAFRGYSQTLKLTEQTGIYNVGQDGPLCGLPGTLGYNDEIIAIQDKEGNVTHVFTKPYEKPGSIYWNVDKMYDSVTELSTRQPNELMVYELDFLVDGELKTLYCRDLEVVNKIDSARVLGLELDEDGYIVSFQSVASASNGGRAAATNYYVSETNYRDGQILLRNKAIYSQATTTSSYFPTEDCKVYDVTGQTGVPITETELKKDDRVICILDSRGRIDTIFVHTRTEGQNLYWNVDRNWNKETLTTNRVPDQNGWYYFKMAVNGEQVTVKTDSLEIANAIEKPVCVGLHLNGDVVTKVVAAAKIYPSGVFASWMFIKEIREDGTIVAERTYEDGVKTQVAKLAENALIFNTSLTSVREGEVISAKELKIGDTIHGYYDYNGDISVLYLVSSLSESDIYWNVDKEQYWDAKQNVSTRRPDANGYYNIRLAVKGEQLTLRTRDKSIVDNLDGRTCFGLKLNGKEIVKVFGAVQTVNTQGGLFASAYHVTAVNGNKITATKLFGTDEGKTDSKTMAYGCQIYDVSSTAKVVGQKIDELHVGDQIRCLLNENKQITVIYVLTSTNHKGNHKCDCCGTTPVWLAWDGKTTITKSGHYVLNSDITAERGIKWSKDLNVTLCLNGHKLTVKDRRVFGNVIGTLNIVDCMSAGHVHGTANNNASVALVEGGTINIYGGTFTAEEVTEVKNGGLFTLIGGGKINMYGGTITGGKTNGYGGNINVSDGVFTMNGGVVSNGTSATGQYGGNIALSGEKAVMILNGGTISGGHSGSYGGNIAVGKTGAKLQINGGTVENGVAATHGGNITVAMGTMEMTGGKILGGTAPKYGSTISAVNETKVTITGGSITGGQMRMSNTGGLTLGGKVTIENLHLYNISLIISQNKPLKDASVKVSMETPGVFAQNVATDLSGCFGSVDPVYAVYFEDNQLRLDTTTIHRHCDCGNVGEHTCDDTIRWQPYVQNMKLVEGGHYFLTDDIVDNIEIADNATVYLCLNGHTISSNARVFGSISAGKTLNLYDCGTTGTVHGVTNNNASVAMVNGGILNIYGGTYKAEVVTEANKNGGLFTVIGGGKINLYGGTITGGKTTGYGGNINISDGTFTMNGGLVSDGTSGEGQYGGNIALSGEKALMILNGGTISGGHSGSYGGNIAVGKTGAKLQINGGTVENGVAATHGGNVSVAMSSATISGASFLGGTAGTVGSSISVMNNASVEFVDCTVTGGQMYVKTTSGLVLGGKMNIDHLHLYGSMIQNHKTTPLTDSAIGITMETPGVFMEEATQDMMAFFTKLDTTLILTFQDGNLSLQKDMRHIHCVCIGSEAVADDHVCTEKQEWTAITGSTTISQDGYYYLDWTGYKGASITVKAGCHGHLCLNGAKMVAKSIITLEDGATLDICDCSENQEGSVSVSASGVRAPVYINVAATVNLYSGTITGSYGGKTFQSVIMDHADARFNMYGGKITKGVAMKSAGSPATDYGGNVAIVKGVFTMYGGQISAGTATTHGGNITASGGSFVMRGGQVTDGTANTYGGNISFVTTNSSGLLVGGSITGGTAVSYANCVYVNNNNVVIGGTAVIEEMMFGAGKMATVSTDVPFSGSIGLALQTAPTKYSTVIKNHGDLSGFACAMEGFVLDLNDNNIVIKPQ